MQRGGPSTILDKMKSLGDEPDRAEFLDHLFSFMADEGQPIRDVPSICKQTIDLYRLYHCTKERGGMQEVCDEELNTVPRNDAI